MITYICNLRRIEYLAAHQFEMKSKHGISASIDYEFTFKVTRSGIIRLTGQHDGFPGYELWRKDDGENPRLLWSHLTNETKASLAFPMEHNIDENLGS